MTIIKTLSKSIREFKKDSILSPVFVVLEVILECMLPFFTARLINQMKQGTTMSTILYYGFILFVMAMLSLLFGIQAGNLPHRLPPVLQGISEETCFRRYRVFLLEILTVLRRLLW